MNDTRLLGIAALAMSLIAAPRGGAAQAAPSSEPVSPRRFAVLAGLGNSFGWLGVQGQAYVARERVSLFAAIGYTPAIDSGDPSGLTVAGGIRGFTHGVRHRGYLELAAVQVVVETSLTTVAGVEEKRFYGPSVQIGYQYTGRSGFTGQASVGVGYALPAPTTGSRWQPTFGLGIGYTFR
jgi:hypothetical protein